MPLDQDAEAKPLTGPLGALRSPPDEDERNFGAPRPQASPERSIVPLPLGDRATVAMVMIGVVLLTVLVAIWADGSQVALFDRALDGERISLAEAEASDNRVAISAVVYFIAYLISGIAFLLWFSRAYRNVLALGVSDPRYRPRWAVAYWFIPIMNLFRPKQVMNDIWRGGDPDLPNPAVGWRELPVPGLLLAWWIAWLISSFVGNFVFGIGGADPLTATTQELRDASVGAVIADVCDVVAGVLAILSVRQVTARVERRRSRIEAPQTTPAVA